MRLLAACIVASLAVPLPAAAPQPNTSKVQLFLLPHTHAVRPHNQIRPLQLNWACRQDGAGCE